MTTPDGEAARKTIHVGLSLIAAAVVAWLPATTAAVVLAAATLVALVVELLRRASGGFGDAFRRRLAPLLRSAEHRALTGATALSVGFTIVAVLLPGTPALAGILVAGVADAAAAVVGRRWGRRRYPGGKSIEGSVAFFAACTALGVWPIGLTPARALIVATVLTPIEALSLRVNDNLYLPLAAATAVLVATGLEVFS